MKELTRAEEQIMQVLWDSGKGFGGHEAFGKSYCYYPLVAKDTYTKKFLKNFKSVRHANFSPLHDQIFNNPDRIVDLSSILPEKTDFFQLEPGV